MEGSFPAPFYPYGLCVAGAALLALALMQWTGKKQGLKNGTVSYLAVLAIPLGVLFARIGYALGRLDLMKTEGFTYFFQFQRGGFMLYGAAAGVLLAAFITAQATHQRFASILDAAAAPAVLLIALCRLAESLVGLGYGEPIEMWFDPFNEFNMSVIAWEDPSILYRFPFALKTRYGWRFGIFLLEALAALGIFWALLTRKRRAPGGRAALAALLYAGCQVLLESMRRDAVVTWGFVKVSQLFSALTVAAVLLICCLRLPRRERTTLRIGGAWAAALLCVGVVIAMEFALQQKIGFLKWMRMDMCYGVMLLACLGLVLIVLPLWKRAFPAAGEAGNA